MIYPHVIRLRDPWSREETGGAIRFRRGFNWVAPLADREELWLVIEDAAGLGAVFANNKLLGRLQGDGGCEEFRFEAPEASNEVRLEFDRSPVREPFAAVRLEVRLGPPPKLGKR